MTTKTDSDSHYQSAEIRKALQFEELYTDADLQKAFGRDAWEKMAEVHPDGTRGDIVHLEYKASGEALAVVQDMFAKVIEYLREQEYQNQGEDFQKVLARRNLMQDIEKTVERCENPLDFYNY